MIELSGISKTFRVVKRRPGLSGAALNLFRREYRSVQAVSELSFHIRPGELVGLIGPNGAGKSTTVKIISGILAPDAGRCEIAGYVPWRDRPRYVRYIGVVFGQRTQLWWDVPVRDSFFLLRDIYKVPQAQFAHNLSRYTAHLDLEGLLDTPLRQLSLGQRMRCELAASLLHSPKLLFLDEPTIGLDAVSKRAVRAFIRDLNREEGVTVILTTHDTNDLEALTERILLLGRGRLLYDGPLSDLRGRFGDERTLTVRFSAEHAPAGPVTPPGAQLVRWNGDTGVLRLPAGQVPAAIAALSAALPLTDIQVEQMSAEELIAALDKEFAI